MNPYIITLIGIGLLAPTIYFVPSNLTVKGKRVLLLASFIIAETGVLALDIFLYWQAAGLLLLLIVLTSYLLHNRAGSMFIDLAEMESGAAKEKSDEPEVYDNEKGPILDDDTTKDENILDEGPSEVDQPGHMTAQSLEAEVEVESVGADIMPDDSAELDDTYTLPGESIEHGELDMVTDNSIELDEQNTMSAESLELDEQDTIPVSSPELDEPYMNPEDNSVYIIDGSMDADTIENIDEAQEEPFREIIEESGLMLELTDEESETPTGGNHDLEDEESYLASIEKMLEEGEMDEIDPLDALTEPYDSTDSKQNELTEKLAFADELTEEADDSDPESNSMPIEEETNSVSHAERDSEDNVLEELEDLPASKEDGRIEGSIEEDVLSSSMKGIPYSSQQQELNTLIIDSLKFAKFEMNPDRYISLLQKQLEKELPVQMHYEIALMLINAFFKAGQFSKSMDLIEEMRSEFGHLPAVSIELETLFANVKKLMV